MNGKTFFLFFCFKCVYSHLFCAQVISKCAFIWCASFVYGCYTPCIMRARILLKRSKVVVFDFSCEEREEWTPVLPFFLYLFLGKNSQTHGLDYTWLKDAIICFCLCTSLFA